MSKSLKIAVVGATGLVGREILAVLAERGFPAAEIVPLASERSAGEKVELGEDELTVRKAEPDAFRGIDLVFMSPGATVSRELAPAAVKAGAVVIDDSAVWRLDPEVPLVVPEVNPGEIARYRAKGIIANPSCATIQMMVALAPLHRAAGLKRVIVSTYQAVSGRGKRGLDELGEQVRALFNQRDVEAVVFPKRIAFNCLPQIDAFADDGFTAEEHRLRDESRKILGAPALGVCATCVRVPVFNGHAESIVAELERPMNAKAARELLRAAPGILLMDEAKDGGYPTPLDAEGTDATFVGRLRDDPTAPNSVAFWCVADNVRKGAAANAVQIAEILVRDYL